jgi:dTDP-4-dehydrorhamnose reductase
MKKILITGASGYLGAYLCRKLSMRGTPEVYALYNSHPGTLHNINYIKCNLLNLDRLTEIFEKVKPDIIYHLASVTPTRIGKRGNDYVEFINHLVTGHIARLCEDTETLLIYTSTDLVYKEGENIHEESTLEPLSIYAESKLNGEDVIKSLAPKYIILRMSLVYGLSLNSYLTFFDEAYRAMDEGKQVKAFVDMYRKPIYVREAAFNLLALPDVYDENIIMNFCGLDYISRYDMCRTIADVCGFNKKLVKKTRCEDISDGRVFIKNLDLNNQLMLLYGLTSLTYNENVQKIMAFRKQNH